jgi:hypothetical protein
MRRHGVLMALFSAGITGLLLLRLFDPAHSCIFPPCPLRYFTGLYCPGCGSLRAIHALLRGDLRQAWAMNALTVTMLPFIGYGLISEIHRHFRGRPMPGMMIPASWIRALCAVIVLFGVARNLPFHPFNLLAPGALTHL